MIAREGDQQEARQIRPDEPLEACRRGPARLGIERRAVDHQQVVSAQVKSVTGCGAHARGIGTGRPPASSLTGGKPRLRQLGTFSRGGGAVRWATVGSAGAAAGSATGRARRAIGPDVSNV